MKAKLSLTCVVLSNLLTLEAVFGAGKVPTPLQARNDGVREETNYKMEETYKKIDQTKQEGQDEFSKVNNFHINFLRELQSNQALCIDVTKIQDPVGLGQWQLKLVKPEVFLNVMRHIYDLVRVVMI